MIEVFQDLEFIGSSADKKRFRQSLLDSATTPWIHDIEREKIIKADNGDDVVVFSRSSDDALPAATLILWEKSYGYAVTNIVPKDIGNLSFSQYNSILNDFLDEIGNAVASEMNFKVDLSSATTTFEDYMSPEAAQLLRRFSILANKATGASHPLDERRWFEFVVMAHSEGASLDAGTLARLLIEEEGWPEEVAHNLAVEYENARQLLEFYDNH